jgi:hypothetical protein
LAEIALGTKAAGQAMRFESSRGRSTMHEFILFAAILAPFGAPAENETAP